MPKDAAIQAVESAFLLHVNNWAHASIFLAKPAFRRSLHSTLVWGAAGLELVYVEALLPERADATVGEVEVVAFTKSTIVQFTGHSDAAGVPSVSVTARKDIQKLLLLEPSDLIGSGLTPPPRETGLALYVRSSTDPLNLGMRGHSPELLAAFYPSLVEDLSK